MTRRGLSFLAALLALSLAVACTSDKPSTADSPTASATTAVQPTAAPSPTPTPEPVPPPQPIVWQPCEDSSLECARLSAPLDYTHPSGEQVELALIRQPARDSANRIGVLVINYGGPGLSGVDRLRDRAANFPAAVQDRFDLVSFDPRGVRYSTPALTCVDDTPREQPAPQAQPWPRDEQDWRDVAASAEAYADACASSGGDLLPYLGTYDVVRDLDRLREALGEEQISFLGQSYGTLIGQVYADQYPQRIRTMVLDGVVDPNLSGEAWAQDQALAFEGALERFFAWCRATACIADGSDPAAALESLIDRAKQGSLTAGERVVGPLEVYLAMLQSMYTSGAWPNFANFINRGNQGSGNETAALADAYQGRQDDGTYDNSSEMNLAVNCLDRDYPRTGAAAIEAMTSRIAALAPHFGAPIGQGGGSCTFWDAAARPLTAGPAADAPPILLIGTTGDPFAPYKQAVDVSRRMATAVLLTYDGESHPAYQRGIPCIDDAVTTYLLTGEPPASGAVCGSAGITPVPAASP